MRVGDLFSRLATGELSNLAIGNEGEIDPVDYATLIHHANEGLVRIYTKLVLLEKDVIIQQVNHITNYYLHRIYAESSGSTQRHKYIKDMQCDPFLQDVITVTAIFDMFGNKISINDADDPYSYFLPQQDMIQVPNPEEGKSISVNFQARHPELVYKTKPIAKVLDQEIMLPFYLEGALQTFVAYKIYSNMNGQENTAKGQEYNATFETILLDILEKDTANQTSQTSHHKLEHRGFV